MSTLNVYIDESGDEGFSIAEDFIGGQGSSHWFILAALVVKGDQDRQVAQSVNRIRSRLWQSPPGQHGKPLHWKELRHVQKGVVLDEMKNEDFTWIAVAFEKSYPYLDRSKFDSKITRSRWLVLI